MTTPRGLHVYEREDGRRIGVTRDEVYLPGPSGWRWVRHLAQSLASNRESQRRHYESLGYRRRRTGKGEQ